MTTTDLGILVQQGEGTTLEFKERLSSSFAREMVAMANTIGGRILVGVRDDGSIRSVADSNAVRARIQDIARNCDPPIDVIVEPIDGVVVVHVRESSTKPVQCGDGFFWRQGAATQKLSRDEIRDFFRDEGAVRFDLALCPRFRYPEDFDRDKFRGWLALSGISGRVRTEDVLVNIEAAERDGERLIFRNAGVLFTFAKRVRRFFNHAYLTCLLAKGTDKVRVLDRKDFDGGIVADIAEAVRFIERNTRTAWRIEGLRREDIPEYPMNGVREAITNTVMHRDWFVDGANVFVELYSDRIEISSPGTLPKGITLSDLGRKSVRRNALIADMLHRIGFIEKAGTGIRRIRDDARDHGCPEPAFEATGFVTATFFPNPQVVGVSTAVELTASSGWTPRPRLGPMWRPKLRPMSPSRGSRRRFCWAASTTSEFGSATGSPGLFGENWELQEGAHRTTHAQIAREDHPRQASQQQAEVSTDRTGSGLGDTPADAADRRRGPRAGGELIMARLDPVVLAHIKPLGLVQSTGLHWPRADDPRAPVFFDHCYRVLGYGSESHAAFTTCLHRHRAALR